MKRCAHYGRSRTRSFSANRLHEDLRFTCCEDMVTKSAALLAQTISKCGIDSRKDLESNVVLSGGVSKVSGIRERLEFELQSGLYNNKRKIKCVACAPPETASWVGLSILSSLSTFATMWISKEEYLDVGPQLVHQRCL
eukprot:PhF_6_TR5755/c0_g1_i1/m.8482